VNGSIVKNGVYKFCRQDWGLRPRNIVPHEEACMGEDLKRTALVAFVEEEVRGLVCLWEAELKINSQILGALEKDS